MLTNDILRRVRYALDLKDARVTELFALTGYELKHAQLVSLFAKEEDGKLLLVPDALAHRFFAGLILSLRGKMEGKPPAPIRTDPISGNDVLWYLRIALELRDDDVIAVMKKGGMDIGKSELGSFFRKKGHPNYRECGDQMLRSFLSGLTVMGRPQS
jgi:uncharacterized protein YehS (DUF1456 family)